MEKRACRGGKASVERLSSAHRIYFAKSASERKIRAVWGGLALEYPDFAPIRDEREILHIHQIWSAFAKDDTDKPVSSSVMRSELPAQLSSDAEIIFVLAIDDLIGRISTEQPSLV